jgi:hypothetical protein
MMASMNRRPTRGCVLECTDAKDCERSFQPWRASQTTVRQQPVEAEVDAKRSENVDADNAGDQSAPAEKPGHQRKGRNEMIDHQCSGIQPVDAHRVGPQWRIEPALSCHFRVPRPTWRT